MGFDERGIEAFFRSEDVTNVANFVSRKPARTPQADDKQRETNIFPSKPPCTAVFKLSEYLVRLSRLPPSRGQHQPPTARYADGVAPPLSPQRCTVILF